MQEYEKQLAGLPYDPADQEIRQFQNNGKRQMQCYNQLEPKDMEARTQALQNLLAHIGQDTHINQPFWIDFGRHITIGSHCIINLNCTFSDTGPITIGDYVLIGPDVKIYTACHPINCTERYVQRPDHSNMLVTMTKPVSIGDYVWVGGGSIILPGVTIGHHAVIGAGSVVTRDIPPYAIACGNPCTIKKWNTQNQTKPEE